MEESVSASRVTLSSDTMGVGDGGGVAGGLGVGGGVGGGGGGGVQGHPCAAGCGHFCWATNVSTSIGVGECEGGGGLVGV